MFSCVYSGAIAGVDAYRIEVEVECSGGMGQINIVGLPDAAVKESQERVRSAIRACQFLMPSAKKWTVNLAPADKRKEGPFLDLPIAVGVLSSSGHILSECLSNYWIVGELGLDGSVRSVSGVLPVALACKASGVGNIIVPEANAAEAALLDGLNVFAVSHLKQVFHILTSENAQHPVHSNARRLFCQNMQELQGAYPDFAEVKGQRNAKRAMMISAAGRHNLIMVGPPGSGKSMLAQRLPGIMPPLEFEEALELTKLYSVAGKLAERGGIICQRPFRAPHHSASLAGLLGGGTYPRPGEISLSHMGILFLDELAEFPRSHLDSLREPIETGVMTISRAQNSFTFPAEFLLVGACNPCPCGYRGDQVKYCNCTDGQALRYWSRISGPVLDRIDLHVEVARLDIADFNDEDPYETSDLMRLQVTRAAQIQKERYSQKFLFNGQLSPNQIRKYCKIDDPSKEIMKQAVVKLGLSARAYDRILRVARTIADLEACENISKNHVAEAIRFRQLSTASQCA